MNNAGYILACVTAQPSCEKIIEVAGKMAKRLGLRLDVITIQPKKKDAKSRSNDMKCLYNLSKKADTEITIYYSSNPIKTIAKHIDSNNPIHIYTGNPDTRNEFVSKLGILVGDIPISMVADDIICTIPPTHSLVGIPLSNSYQI